MLILHFIGLAMGLGTGFAHAFLGGVLSKLDRDEAKKFRHQLMALSSMGTIGIILLVVSGIYLIIPYRAVILTNTLLLTKLILVFILIVLIALMGREAKKAYKEDIEGNAKKVGYMGKLTLLISITIVIVAVNVFH